ncbi:MAG: hypothetical protein Q9173_000102 [Seirophora scorigena]
MVGVKRAFDPPPQNARHRILTEDQLRAIEKDDLISYILKLQSQITRAAQASPTPPPAATPELCKKTSPGKCPLRGERHQEPGGGPALDDMYEHGRQSGTRGEKFRC